MPMPMPQWDDVNELWFCPVCLVENHSVHTHDCWDA